MNCKRRKKMQEVIYLLERASNLLELLLDEEQDCLSNIPENLESSAQYSKIEETIDDMNTALESIEQAVEYVSTASE